MWYMLRVCVCVVAREVAEILEQVGEEIYDWLVVLFKAENELFPISRCLKKSNLLEWLVKQAESMTVPIETPQIRQP